MLVKALYKHKRRNLFLAFHQSPVDHSLSPHHPFYLAISPSSTSSFSVSPFSSLTKPHVDGIAEPSNRKECILKDETLTDSNYLKQYLRFTREGY